MSITFIFLFYFIHWLRRSKMAKRWGLAEQPCQQLHSSVIEFDRLPLILIIAVGLLYRACMVLINVSWKLNHSSTQYKKCYLMESNTFSASNPTTIASIRFSITYCITCSVHLMLSCVCLCLINPVWYKWIISGRIFSIRLARIAVNYL